MKSICIPEVPAEEAEWCSHRTFVTRLKALGPGAVGAYVRLGQRTKSSESNSWWRWPSQEERGIFSSSFLFSLFRPSVALMMPSFYEKDRSLLPSPLIQSPLFFFSLLYFSFFFFFFKNLGVNLPFISICIFLHI